MQFTLNTAKVREQPKNNFYPYAVKVTCERELMTAVATDYTSITFKGGIRSRSNFLCADAVIADVDNDGSENAADWVDVDDIRAAFPDVAFAIHRSRNHMKVKSGRPARPKLHVIFPVPTVNSAEEYENILRRLLNYVPWFDPAAKDAARFFFGTEPTVGPGPKSVELVDGSRDLKSFLDSIPLPTAPCVERPHFKEHTETDVIPEGRRNSTVYAAAVESLIFHGEGEAAMRAFRQAAARCSPPLGERELCEIWNSACRTARERRSRPDYLPKEQFLQARQAQNVQKGPRFITPAARSAPQSASSAALPQMRYRPEDYTDVGQAKVFAELYADELRWCSGIGWLTYDGMRWREDPCDALEQSTQLTDQQKGEAMQLMQACRSILAALGIPDPESVSGKMVLNPQQEAAYKEWLNAKSYASYVDSRRMSARLKAATEVAQPELAVHADKLDADPYLLNTPAGTVDLADEGKLRHHDHEDLITKLTAASLGTDEHGRAIWQKTLAQLFLSDEELIAYVQQLCGNMLIGKVNSEELILAIGSGANGKSTFFNAIRMVMGDYAGTISSDVLLAGTMRNTGPEKATLRGLRFALASELPMGGKLNANLVKQLCSTDMIRGEAKYKAPVSFTPTHTLVVLTNNLPSIPDTDEGTWRRIRLIPFNAVFEGDRDCKNFAEVLYEESGSAILDWMIAGAKRVIAQGMHVTVPESIKALTNAYRMENDWVLRFLQECTEPAEGGKVTMDELYAVCIKWCTENDNIPPNRNMLGKLMSAHGYKAERSSNVRFYKGLHMTAKEM